jgi:hypothetical protein
MPGAPEASDQGYPSTFHAYRENGLHGCATFPPTTGPWQWQLSDDLDTLVEADVWDIDGECHDADVIAALRAGLARDLLVQRRGAQYFDDSPSSRHR